MGGTASRTSSSSRIQEDRAADISSIVKKCNELDLHIIVIWKVHAGRGWRCKVQQADDGPNGAALDT